MKAPVEPDSLPAKEVSAKEVAAGLLRTNSAARVRPAFRRATIDRHTSGRLRQRAFFMRATKNTRGRVALLEVEIDSDGLHGFAGKGTIGAVHGGAKLAVLDGFCRAGFIAQFAEGHGVVVVSEVVIGGSEQSRSFTNHRNRLAQIAVRQRVAALFTVDNARRIAGPAGESRLLLFPFFGAQRRRLRLLSHELQNTQRVRQD